MAHHYAAIAFTDQVKTLQEQYGSRRSYAKMETRGDSNGRLSKREMDFISARDSVYIATVSATGWPYLQHRGGPQGFIKILSDQSIGFADFRGNRQYISVGNLAEDNRLSLFFMDYANRQRLKMFGRAAVHDDPALMSSLTLQDYGGKVERAMVIEIEAFDWNCPQHITPRYTMAEIELMAEAQD